MRGRRFTVAFTTVGATAIALAAAIAMTRERRFVSQRYGQPDGRGARRARLEVGDSRGRSRRQIYGDLLKSERFSRVHRTRMTRIERIDAELFWFYPR
jgi:hypothetical protein